MIATAKTYRLLGIDTYPATVECEVTPGIGVHIVGLPDSAIKESLLRVVTALAAKGYFLPGKKVIINVAPVMLMETSLVSGLDLPMALTMLAASERETLSLLNALPAAGELCLDGSVRAIRGAFCMAEKACYDKAPGIILPELDAAEIYASGLLPKSFKIWGIATLDEALSILRGAEREDLLAYNTKAYKSISSKPRKATIPYTSAPLLRATQIAAAGGFNLSIDASRDVITNTSALLALLLSNKENDTPSQKNIRTEQARIWSISGRLGILDTCPTVPLRRPSEVGQPSVPALVGGGREALPGETSLAHGGILHIDNPEHMPIQHRELILSVQQQKSVTITRLKAQVQYPADFKLVIANNSDEARSTKAFREMTAQSPTVHVTYQGHTLYLRLTEERLTAIKKTIDRAVALQQQRYADEGFSCNAAITAKKLDTYIPLTKECRDTLERIITQMDLLPSATMPIVTIARTIADLDGSVDLTPADLAEATGYQYLFRKNLWK